MTKHEMHILDQTGHTTTEWNTQVPAEVEMAKETFDKLRSKGYQAFGVNSEGEQGRRMDTFDPMAGKMIMAPRLQGG
jgi:hypothetical protein